MLLDALSSTAPLHAVLRVLLDPWLDLCLVQIEVVDRSYSHNELPWVPLTNTIQQSAASRAEVVLHRVARLNCLGLGEFGEKLLATNVLGRRLIDDEVGREHGGCDLAAVGAVADEAVHKVFAFGGLRRKVISSSSITPLS